VVMLLMSGDSGVVGALRSGGHMWSGGPM
jgi:hypothetical protein